MYPYLRTARALVTAQFGPRLTFDSESVLGMWIWLGDIDVFWELNNGRHLTLMDMGRFDLAVRSGFLKVLHREGWGLTVGGASVRFRHRVPPFSRIRLRTRVVGHDDRWFYFHQKIERGDRRLLGGPGTHRHHRERVAWCRPPGSSRPRESPGGRRSFRVGCAPGSTPKASGRGRDPTTSGQR